MTKSIWRWIFYQKNKKELSALCNKLNIQIPGFRKGSIPAKLKPMVISQLLLTKNLNGISNVPIKLNNELEEIHDFDSMSVEEYYSLELAPSLMLHRLLSNGESKKATSLYNKFIKEHGEKGLIEIESERNRLLQGLEKEEGEKGEGEDNNDYSSKLVERSSVKINKKLEQKIQRLQEELDRVQKEYTDYREENNEKRKENISEIQRLRGENGVLNKEYILLQKKYKEERRLWDIEKVKLQEELEIIKTEKISVHSKLLKLDNTKEKKAIDEYSIIIIGNPQNTKILNDFPVSYTIVEKEQLSEVNWDSSKEIWVLTYKVDRRMVHDLEHGKGLELQYVDTFQQLREKIEIMKGCLESEKSEVGR
jgi:hypothetical protein